VFSGIIGVVSSDGASEVIVNESRSHAAAMWPSAEDLSIASVSPQNGLAGSDNVSVSLFDCIAA